METMMSKYIFRFEERVGDLYLTDPKGDKHYLERQNGNYKGNLTYDGTYYLEKYVRNSCAN
jgi:hypothetical protein